MHFINFLIDSYNIPLLTAFLLGVLTSVSPCPLATNIAAISYLAKEIQSSRRALLGGLFYTFGRGVSYTAVAALIYFGLSSFGVSRVFQGWGDKILGPILILVGLAMLGVIKINFGRGGRGGERAKAWLSQKGFFGAFCLGALFALAFCPYSGVLFFGALIPLVLKSAGGLALPAAFAVGTGLPVIFFSFLIAFAAHKLSGVFGVIQKTEKVVRYVAAAVFLGVGAYYLQYSVKYLVGVVGWH